MLVAAYLERVDPRLVVRPIRLAEPERGPERGPELERDSTDPIRLRHLAVQFPNR